MALEQELFYKRLVATQLAAFQIWTLQLTQWKGKELVDLTEKYLALREKDRTASRDRESFPKQAWADSCLSAFLGIYNVVGHVSMTQQSDYCY